MCSNFQRDGVFTSIVMILGIGIVIVRVARSGLITNIYVRLKDLIGMSINRIIIFIKDSLYRLKIADKLMIIILI